MNAFLVIGFNDPIPYRKKGKKSYPQDGMRRIETKPTEQQSHTVHYGKWHPHCLPKGKPGKANEMRKKAGVDQNLK